MESTKEMLRPADVAAFMGCTTARIYQMCRSGELPHTRMGKAVLIPRRAWEAWVSAKTALALASIAGRSARDGSGNTVDEKLRQNTATSVHAQNVRTDKEEK